MKVDELKKKLSDLSERIEGIYTNETTLQAILKEDLNKYEKNMQLLEFYGRMYSTVYKEMF